MLLKSKQSRLLKREYPLAQTCLLHERDGTSTNKDPDILNKKVPVSLPALFRELSLRDLLPIPIRFALLLRRKRLRRLIADHRHRAELRE